MTTGRINQVAAVARKVSRTKLGPLLPGLAWPAHTEQHQHQQQRDGTKAWGIIFFSETLAFCFSNKFTVCLFVVGIPQLSGATIHAGIRSEGFNLAPAEAMIRAAPARHF